MVSVHIPRNCKLRVQLYSLTGAGLSIGDILLTESVSLNCVSSSEVTMAFSLYIRSLLSIRSLLLNTFELPPATGTHLNLYIFLILKHLLIAVANRETKEIFSAAVVHPSKKDPAKSI